MINISMDEDDLVEGLFRECNKEELLDLIMALDLRVGEVGFTEDLINRLKESLDKDIGE